MAQFNILEVQVWEDSLGLEAWGGLGHSGVWACILAAAHW